MSRMKLIALTLALLATLLVFTACGNPISEIVHGDPPQAGTPDASDPLSPEPEPEPEETEEQRRARLIKDGGYLCGGRADGELHLHPQ